MAEHASRADGEVRGVQKPKPRPVLCGRMARMTLGASGRLCGGGSAKRGRGVQAELRPGQRARVHASAQAPLLRVYSVLALVRWALLNWSLYRCEHPLRMARLPILWRVRMCVSLGAGMVDPHGQQSERRDKPTQSQFALDTPHSFAVRLPGHHCLLAGVRRSRDNGR